MRSIALILMLAAGGFALPVRADCPTCKGPDYESSLGPFRLFDSKGRLLGQAPVQAPSPTLPVDDEMARKTGALPPAGQEAGEQQPVENTGGYANANDRFMWRMGEMDARQGRPLNMRHAASLPYMQGYTAGRQ